jgi:PII-like signaling protein
MEAWPDAVMVRVFVGEDVKFHGLPLYEAVVLKAREMHLRGATVLKGQLGFGHSSRLHTAKILRLAQDLPLIVEIVDSQERIDAFLPALDGMLSGGLVTLEKVKLRSSEKPHDSLE